MKEIILPEPSLILLIGPSGSGKSTFARHHFAASEIISSDQCRAMIGDDASDQSVTSYAFELLRDITEKRMLLRKLVVVDATNVQAASRKKLLELARKYHYLANAIVFDLPTSELLTRNLQRSPYSLAPQLVKSQSEQLKHSLKSLDREGFRFIHVFNSPFTQEEVKISRQKLWNNREHDCGPFDIIGDVHGCYDELVQLLEKCGYQLQDSPPFVTHPNGRRLIFVGDLVDRGPDSPKVLRLVMNLVAAGMALCVPGNHEIKLLRKLQGRKVKVTHGLEQTMQQLADETPEFLKEIARFIDGLVSHYVLDHGKLVVAHAGLREDLQGRSSGIVRNFCLYGETTGELDGYGLPVRYDWSSHYRGKAMVVYGHTPVSEASWINNTICIDTGCVFGGHLTALRYPERDCLQVKSQKVYCEPIKPVVHDVPLARPLTLDIQDVMGRRRIETSRRTITIEEEQAAAAFEAINRFGIDPRWLIYLPPTMSPPVSHPSIVLEHPLEAFQYYSKRRVGSLMCQEKHMGSRAIFIVGRDCEAIQKRFGMKVEHPGTCYTRKGRRFFLSREHEVQVVEQLRDAIDQAGIFDLLNTDWLCLDSEVLPWSYKSEQLIRHQYAATATAGIMSLERATAALSRLRHIEGQSVHEHFRQRLEHIRKYQEAYNRYCWPVNGVRDLRIAPFQVMAGEGMVFANHSSQWHMDICDRLVQANNSLFKPTQRYCLDLNSAGDREKAVNWWEQLTRNGAEGMVVKPLDPLSREQFGNVLPAIKCRGPEYLRIIYGPEYLMPEHMELLRSRSLKAKRDTALQEFILGIEALERFTKKAPFHEVHQCVFGILALEHRALDPRL
jgi:protein phosphatase